MASNAPDNLESYNQPTVLQAPDAPPTMASTAQSKVTINNNSPRREFGDYELLQELGRGGMGVVYKAYQKGLDRVIALKMILPGSVPNEDELKRFRTEAEAAARLQHPNIVAVHGVGEFEGQHFYSMEYIEGPSLAARLAHGALPGKVAARYVMILARALHYAHGHGILHRDLKPSNVLLDKYDQPHVTDFGLAKKLGDSGLTQTGAILGTPSYMAPEQAAGKTKELGPAADVYGLGAVLYELLAGRPAFRAESPLDTIQKVIEEEPLPPSELNDKVDKDVETICLKCLQKDPRQRYASAEVLAEDLNRYVSGESIEASSFNVIDRLAWELERSQFDVEFKSWSQVLYGLALIMLWGHVAMFWLLHLHQTGASHWVVRLVWFCAIALTFLWFRSKPRAAPPATTESIGLRARFAEHLRSYIIPLLPTKAAERQLWAIWAGYLIGYVIIVLVFWELARREQLHWNEYAIYPFSAVLAGLAFFAMGSTFWGKCYIVGLQFFGVAAVMPIKLDWAPLELGVVWCIMLTWIAHRVRKLGAEAEVARKHP